MFDGFDRRSIDVGEANIYVVTGGSGPPLLLLHGYPQTHVAWHRVAAQLSEHFTLVMPDLRGYGKSRGPQPDVNHLGYSKRAMATDMVAVMTTLGHDAFHVAGHDRGGRVGYRLCLDSPAKVLRFAALDIVPTGEVWAELDADKALASYHWQFLAVPSPVPETLIGANPRFYIEHLLSRWAGDVGKLDTDAVNAYVEQFEDSRVRAATCEDYRAGASVDREHDMLDMQANRTLDCPMLLIWGRGYLTRKASSPMRLWQRWANDVTEAALDCGHFVAEEAPEETAAALITFFQGT